MIQKAKDNWRNFKQSESGYRFQDHHHRYRKGCAGRSSLRGFFGIIAGFLVVVGGLIAVPGPGPGWLIILLGLGMVAGESLFFARLLDRSEVRLIGAGRWVAGIWVPSSAFAKVLMASTVLACVVVAGCGIYYLVSGS